MSHAFAADLLLGDLNTTTVTNDPLVTDPLVLPAMAFIILNRTENPFAEQTVALWFIGPVINGFWLQDFTTGLFQDLLGRCQSNSNLCKSRSDL